MMIIALLPIFFSSLLIAAHFYRSGSLVLTVVCLLLPLLMFARKCWVPWVVSLFLLLSAAEWLRTMLMFIEHYQAAGLSWTRLAIILSAVSFFTALSALVFKTPGMKRRYKPESNR